MTFAVLRELHAIIGNALDDIENVYLQASSSTSPLCDTPATPTRSSCESATTAATTPKGLSFANGHCYASPPPSPAVSSFLSESFFLGNDRPSSPSAPLDFPSLDAPCNPTTLSETLVSHPAVMSAISRIVAASGQLASTVQVPFLSLSDASMSYHLPACLRLLEASHTVEILREAGPSGLHVKMIAEKTGVEKSKLAHTLRLLATHHLLREVSPNVFANNRISSMIDTGKSFEEIQADPDAKYRSTNGISAFIGMCTDELQKSAAYITEAYLLSSNALENGQEPTHAPFNFAFGCEGVGFFSWLEGEGIDNGQVNGPGRDIHLLAGINPSNVNSLANSNRYRLERFGMAMTGTDSWEVPGAVLNGFDWHTLPKGSVVVDVGGGIGSTSMFLALAFSNPADEDTLGLRFIIQDRPIVVDMGEKAWREKCPELLEGGVAQFQVHDFFTPQPIRNADVYFLRVILHDWPDAFAQRILLRLREASKPDTKLVLADFVLPLACTDELDVDDDDEHSLAGIAGVESSLAPAPLLPNLGKASANAYWMDLTMQAVFNGKERTLREMIALTASAGWKVIKVTKAPGSLFGHIVAVPGLIPLPKRSKEGGMRSAFDAAINATHISNERRLMELANSRCGTPSLGSRTELPSLEESRTRFGGRLIRGIGRRVGFSGLARLTSNSQIKKKKPSPLSVSSPIPISISPRSSLSFSPPLNTGYAASTNDLLLPPLSPMPRRRELSRETLLAQLSQSNPSVTSLRQDHMPSPSKTPPSPRTLTHFSSQSQLLSSPTGSRNAPTSPIASRARGLIPRRASLAQLKVSSSPSSSTSSSPIPPVPDLPVSYSLRSPMFTSKDIGGTPSDRSLSKKRSESLLSLPFKHSRNRSGSFLRGLQIPRTGRRIAFSDRNVQENPDALLDVDTNSTLLAAPARIDKPDRMRSKARPASPF